MSALCGPFRAKPLAVIQNRRPLLVILRVDLLLRAGISVRPGPTDLGVGVLFLVSGGSVIWSHGLLPFVEKPARAASGLCRPVFFVGDGHAPDPSLAHADPALRRRLDAHLVGSDAETAVSHATKASAVRTPESG